MNLTFGERNNLSRSVIDKIRSKIREESLRAGHDEARRKHEIEEQAQKNRVCKQAEEEIDKEFSRKESRWISVIKTVSIVIALAFVVISFYVALLQQSDSSAKYVIFFLTVITTVEGALPFFSKESYPIRFCKRYLKRKKLLALDARKEHYLALLEK